MGVIDFNKLPVNTLIGADWRTFCRVTKGKKIDKGYRVKYTLTKCICRLLSSFKGIQDRRYDKQLRDLDMKHPPIFILGHWRSGTTYLHNVMSQDKNFGYNTTYQTVMPHLMMWGQPMFKKSTSWVMPDKRPTDNMELSVDQPQEEEFALSNMTEHSYYHIWFFPQLMNYYADRYLLFDTIEEEELTQFEESLTKLIKISLWNTKGEQFLSKNPPHTGRVKELLKIFPDAKFIYLMRNPYSVFESTRSFFTKTIKPLQLQDITDEELEENILSIYEKLYHKYEADKHLIPEGNLIEVKFEDYEADALSQTELIYKTLGLSGFDKARADIERYVSKKKSHKKTKYNFDERTRKLVEQRWGFALKDWGYKL